MRKRMTSLLLTLVMLLSLVPAMGVTALAADNYPSSITVYNKNKTSVGLNDGQCLASNAATSATDYTSGDSYVARYDKSKGTLYLNGYEGFASERGIAAAGDLNIVVESDSSFTTTNTTTQSLMGIQANGKLKISGNGKLTVKANGNGKVYGISAQEGVTISAPLDVTVGKEVPNSSKNGAVYGIYTQSGAISLSDKDKTIAATGGAEFACGVYNDAKTSSTAADNGNINISGKLTVNLDKDNSNGGIYTDGGTITLDGATVNISSKFASGIYNFNGGVVIKNGSKVTLSSDKENSRGIWTNKDGYSGKLSIADSTITISVYTRPVEVRENVSIKDSTVDLTMTSEDHLVIKTSNIATNTIDLSGTGTVTLTASGKQTFAMINGAKVSLGANTICEMGHEDNNTYGGEYDKGSNTTVLKFVHEDPAPATYTVSFDANGGTGSMADATGVSGDYELPVCGFTAPNGKQFKAWSVGGVEKAVGDKITVNANTTVTAVWEAIEYNVTVTGGTASVGAGTPITKATMGTTVTLTANAASSDKVFDKWEVVSGGITLADANSTTTTFTMPASAVSVKATYKNAPVTTYNLTTQVNGGHGTISASKTGLAADSTETVIFTPDAGYEIDTVTVNGTATSVSGNTLNVTMNENKTVVVTYKAIEYNITVTDGKATVGAGSEISKAAQGTIVTLTANAAPFGKVFDKWEVVSGGITLADANSATTTFTMPASAVSVKATYKNAPHTHTYNQETVKPEALKTPADCTSNAVYFKSCSCGAISTTDTFVAMDTALGHAYGSDWKYDSTNHWHECSRCHDKKDEAAHDYGSDNVCDTCGYDKTVPHTHNLTLVPAKAATCTNPGNSAYYTCDGCDKWFEDATGSVEITDKTSVKIPAPGHTAGTEWKSDDTNHWHECTVAGCGVIIESTKSTHTAGEWIVDTPATATTAGTKHKECTVCKKVLETATIPATHSHSYGTDWKYDDTNHWHECACGDKADIAAHSASDWIIDTPATATTSGTKHKECTVCKRVLETGTIPATGGSEHSHSYGSEWKNDATNHWHECSCGDKADKAAHSFKWVVDKEATATKKGSKHQECKVCGYKKAAVEIPATGSTTKPSDPTQTNPSTGAESPKTGDNSNMILWIALLFVSGGVLTVLGLNGKKRKESEAE